MKLRFVAVLVPLAALAACSSGRDLPNVSAGASPADPSARLRSTDHTSPLGDYHHREPVEPAPWRQLNDEQAPGKGNAS